MRGQRLSEAGGLLVKRAVKLRHLIVREEGVEIGKSSEKLKQGQIETCEKVLLDVRFFDFFLCYLTS